LFFYVSFTCLEEDNLLHKKNKAIFSEKKLDFLMVFLRKCVGKRKKFIKFLLLFFFSRQKNNFWQNILHKFFV
ncbi:MAG: hypothetical protein ACRCYP_06130, partial [Alphaproteobacteria bacterium]